jgi:hypothetical protein
MRIVTKQSSGEVSVTWKDKTASGSASIEHLGQVYSDVASTTLVPNIQGGKRSAKGIENSLRTSNTIDQSEWVIPARDSPLLDKFGNMKGSSARKMITDLQAYHRLLVSNNKERNTSPDKIRYFMNLATWRKTGKKLIFRTKNNNDIELIAIATGKEPQYKKRFSFYDVAEKAYELAFDEEFDRVFDRLVNSDKPVRCVPRKAKQGQGT